MISKLNWKCRDPYGPLLHGWFPNTTTPGCRGRLHGQESGDHWISTGFAILNKHKSSERENYMHLDSNSRALRRGWLIIYEYWQAIWEETMRRPANRWCCYLQTCKCSTWFPEGRMDIATCSAITHNQRTTSDCLLREAVSSLTETRFDLRSWSNV